MAVYVIDGITYDEDNPHSRIEKQLMDILKNMDDNSSDNTDPDNQNGGD